MARTMLQKEEEYQKPELMRGSAIGIATSLLQPNVHPTHMLPWAVSIDSKGNNLPYLLYEATIYHISFMRDWLYKNI